MRQVHTNLSLKVVSLDTGEIGVQLLLDLSDLPDPRFREDNGRAPQICASWCSSCANAKVPAVQAFNSICEKHALAAICAKAPSGGPAGSHQASIDVLTVYLS